LSAASNSRGGLVAATKLQQRFAQEFVHRKTGAGIGRRPTDAGRVLDADCLCEDLERCLVLLPREQQRGVQLLRLYVENPRAHLHVEVFRDRNLRNNRAHLAERGVGCVELAGPRLAEAADEPTLLLRERREHLVETDLDALALADG
jgi:hypothetical protein